MNLQNHMCVGNVGVDFDQYCDAIESHESESECQMCLEAKDEDELELRELSPYFNKRLRFKKDRIYLCRSCIEFMGEE